MIPKIAIKGHLTRGNEVIQILENLGGKNKQFHRGINENCFYELHSDNYILCANTRSEYFKYYTLEEFEKEYPFKIGDKVIYDYTPNFVGTVVDIKFDDNIPYRVNINGTICTCGTNMLKLCKEMKEKRNITLTLEKAKEWYNKGGELKEVALQAFSEKELNPLPRSWEDYSENYCIEPDEAYIDSRGNILSFITTTTRKWNHICPSKKSAEAHLALIQLEQLRDCYRQGDVPDFNNDDKKYCIIKIKNDIHVGTCYNTSNFLSFTKKEVAEKFLINFKPLIKIAEDYI